MDVAALRDRIQSTLDVNADNRRQAELDLKYVCVGIEARSHSVWHHTYFIFSLGRDATRIYKCALGYFAGGTEQCRSTVG